MYLVLIGIGGILGGIARYKLGKLITAYCKTTFPLGIFVINITGAALLGLISGINRFDENIYLLLGDGFLGAFTTFSTFMYEGFTLLRSKNEKFNAPIYILGSLITGIIFYIAGNKAASLFS